MRLVLLFSLAAFAAYYYFSSSLDISLQGIKLETTRRGSIEICKNYRGCIGIYIAPWCSACHATIPLINELLSAKNAQTLNLMVVIGSDQPQNLRQFSSEISGSVYLDTQDKFLNTTNYSSVPRWFVINDKQEIIDDFSLWYLPSGSPEEKVEYFKKQYAAFLVN